MAAKPGTSPWIWALLLLLLASFVGFILFLDQKIVNSGKSGSGEQNGGGAVLPVGPAGKGPGVARGGGCDGAGIDDDFIGRADIVDDLVASGQRLTGEHIHLALIKPAADGV